MSHIKRAALAATAACLLAAPGAASAATPTTTAAAPAPVATTPAPTTPTRATPGVRVQIGATTGVILLGRTETRQVGQGGAWVVAGAVAAALAPSTAGAGTVAAIAVGVALGSVGNNLINAQLAKGQCLKVSVPWLSLGTVARIGWYPCPA